MSHSNTVSVVVPTFNRADIILGTLETVWTQTHRPIELIVVDDGSRDATEHVIRTWSEPLDQPGEFVVRYIRQENQGANAARNRGVAEATGEFIAFLDSDDQWFPDKLAKQLAVFHSNPKIGGVYCGLQYKDLVTGELEPPNPRAYPAGDILSLLLVHDVTEGEPCWIVRKSCLDDIGPFDAALPARLGWDLWIRLAEKYEIGVVPEVLVYGGTHIGERIRSNPMREIEGHRMIFEKYAALRKKQPLSVRLAARSAMYRRRGRVYFHRGVSWPKAVGYQVAAILVWPVAFDSYAALGGMLLPAGFRQRLHVAWNRVFGTTAFAIRSH